MIFTKDIKFYGTYRVYQQRVLDNLEQFLDNEKIHIVAAPGSGKTILGLELIKRLDNVSLILVPSIAIREQWIERFKDNFIQNKEDADNWISNDIKNKKPIMCITYQSFYSAYQKEKSNQENQDEDELVEDYSNFDFIKAVKEYNIKTLCLDECHHLKLEWWKALEHFTKIFDNLKIIALTATPPFDATPQEWQRYINLCGPIDEEILVPELISDNNLCPHQDYVYFSYPRKDEEIKILKYYSSGIKLFNELYNDEELLKIVKSNTIYQNYKKYREAYYNNELYYQGMVCYLAEKGIKIPFKVKLLAQIRKFDINMMDALLTAIIYDDQSSYGFKDYISKLKKKLSAKGMSANHKINLVSSDKIDKLLSLSISKLDSIKEIIEHEVRNNSTMKCAILTDYIKEKDKRKIGNEDIEISQFGSIPIFEYLRRKDIKNTRLCCLTGSIVIVHKDVLSKLEGKYSSSQFGDSDYYEISVATSYKKKLVIELTKRFEEGDFNVLIGTKSLLGEGWDSPCIDTLIIASFIGSYVLSNQIRGRAIRKYGDKVANIWHLATLDPYDYHRSSDFEILKKRFDTFLGIDFDNHQIENGINRLGISSVPASRKISQNFNVRFLQESTKREEVRNVWNCCIKNAKHISSVTKITIVPKKRLKKDTSFFLAAASSILFLIALFVSSRIFYSSGEKFFAAVVSFIFIGIFGLGFLAYTVRAFILGNTELKLHTLSYIIVSALRKIGRITTKKIKIITKSNGLYESLVYLEGATTYEQNLFSDSLIQMLGPVDKPRYLISYPRGIRREFYVVPDAFKKRKELALPLYKRFRLIVGNCALSFTKKEENKNEALFAEKIYYFKYGNSIIKTKNKLLQNKYKKSKK